MAVSGPKKEGDGIEKLKDAIDRREMSASTEADQRVLLGVEEPDPALGEWPLSGPSDPESVLPDDDELHALEPSEDGLRTLRGMGT